MKRAFTEVALTTLVRRLRAKDRASMMPNPAFNRTAFAARRSKGFAVSFPHWSAQAAGQLVR
jgi:hypothetical protein